MKISSWQDIIVSWANALRLLDEPVNDVLDLVKGSFFVKLLNKIKNVDQDGVSSFSEDDVYNVIENFLKDEFSGFRLLGYWDNDEVTLVSSVMLLWSSLESQSCRTPLYQLEDAIQIKIQAFIQRFIETPQHLVNRQLVMDAVLDITFDLESEDESLSFSSSPRTYSTPKRPNTNGTSYSPAFMALSEVRSLRSKLDLLNCEKQHLQEELEVTKAQLNEKQSKLQQKEVELIRLKNLVASDTTEFGHSSMDEQKLDCASDYCKNSSVESSLVKMELEDLKDILSKLRQELDTTLDENNNLSQQLNEEKKRRIEADERYEEMVTKNITLTKETEELAKIITSLKKTYEEQKLILAERFKPLDDDSLKYIDCETLEGIVDIKYSEIKEELKVQTDLLEEKSKEVKELIKSKEIAESTIDVLNNEIDKLRLEFTDCKKVTKNCLECEILRQKITSSQLNYNSKENECEKLKHEFVQNANELKSLMNYKSNYEIKMADLQKEYVESINEHNIRIDSLKEEVLALECELCEKDNVIAFYKDETDFLNSCLTSKTVEFNKLESDYTKISRSKDREINQLMKTVEHLNKEVRVMQETLQEELSKRDRMNYSVSDWRQKLSQVTANEEIARELIGLHESLQWKTVKISELSLQMDQLKSELVDKETLNKELHERLVFLSEKNRDINKELQTSNNTRLHLQSKISNLEFSERRLSQEVVKKNKQYELVDYELKELWKLIKQKFHTIDLEMDTCMLRGKTDLQDIIKFIDFMSEKLKENKKNINHLSIAINELEADNSEKTAELEMVECKLEELASVNGSKVVERWVNDNSFFHDRMKKIETDYENNMIKLQDTLTKLDKANECLDAKDEKIIDLQAKVEQLNQELKVKIQLVECLQQNVNLYEHEKSILKKKLNNLSCSEKVDGLQIEHPTKTDGSNELVEELQSADFSSFEEKSSQSFHEKLLDLQAKMGAQYDDNIKRISEEYTRKIDQLKGKVKKDCAHIEHLSSELWETSDRLLLSQQEAEALRSQLRKTKMLLTEQNNRGTEDCSSFMWLGGREAGDYVEEFVSTVSRKQRLGTDERQSEFDEEDGMFNQDFLEDLKAGICRLPSPIGRVSCPPESTHLVDDGTSTFLAPSGKPRKLKGSIMYRKPGPPTPSISAARHSLPGNELRRGLREQNTNLSSGRSRLSQLFGSITLTKSTRTLQDSPTPKTKRKGFFQRTFGNRENLPPKV